MSNKQLTTHALHTERINLSPFTKDFRVWGASNEYISIFFRLSSGSFIYPWKAEKIVTYCRSKVQSFSEHIGNDDKKIDFTETNKLSTEMNHSALIAQMWACRNCLRQLYLKLKWRGIGYSFQLAITAPLYSITGYCIATAQSCHFFTFFHSYTYLPNNLFWIRMVTFYSLHQLDKLLHPANAHCHCQRMSQFRNRRDSKLSRIHSSITTKLIVAWFTSTRGVYQYQTQVLCFIEG